jgi:hypothetical protein
MGKPVLMGYMIYRIIVAGLMLEQVVIPPLSLYQPYATGGNRKAVYYTLHQIAFILMPTEGVVMVPEITYGKLNYSNLATKQG